MPTPLLIDRLIANGPSQPGGRIPDAVWRQLCNARINAQRFVFDGEASEMVGDFACNSGDLVITNRQFSIPPYPIVYVEVDSKEFFRHTRQDVPEIERDERLGYLAIGHTVYTLFARKGDVGLSYWSYKLAPPGQDAGPTNVPLTGELSQTIQDAITGGDLVIDLTAPEIAKIALMLGGACRDVRKIAPTLPQQEELAKSINRECALRWVNSKHIIAAGPIPTKFVASFVGDVRNFWALMLWLNQPSRMRVIGSPAGVTFARGKRVPYLSHNIVTLHLGRAKTIRRAYELAAERRSPKGHDVRGHFRHRGGYRSCFAGEGHAWPDAPDDDGHWHCKRCGMDRWHVTPHRRGDAGKGYVLKSYEVTGDHDRP